MEYINELEAAYEIIQKFDDMYQKKSMALHIVCRHNLENVKLKNYAEESLFFDFEKCINELKQAGAVISEQKNLNCMGKLLPQNYSHVGNLIYVLPEQDRTAEYLKSKIKLKRAEEQSSETSHDNSNAFRAETKTS